MRNRIVKVTTWKRRVAVVVAVEVGYYNNFVKDVNMRVGVTFFVDVGEEV